MMAERVADGSVAEGSTAQTGGWTHVKSMDTKR